ncbi:MAG: hypothetical protein ISN28_13960 [Ectothiorhodospiraceae bacterium AqS1]|nr:hypothetical protein [Ectothiorhodospiraceae bacterium AqS1]
MKFAEEKTAHLAEEPWRLSGTGVYVVNADWRLLDGCWEYPSADFIVKEEAFAYARSLAAASTEAVIFDIRLPIFPSMIGTFKPEHPSSPEKGREDTCP